MSFPLDYRFYGDSFGTKYRLVGNAVPPRLSYALAKAIAVKEKLSIPKNYKRLGLQDDDPDFMNLNGRNIPVKKERNKKEIARFKYHIPYMIVNRFRVELTNYNSDFENREFRWYVEIHRSQGPSAEVFTPEIPQSTFNNVLEAKMKRFVLMCHAKVNDAYEFQKTYCSTENEKKAQELLGPYELLATTRDFLDQLSGIDGKIIEIQTRKQRLVLPMKIAAGYYVLSTIVKKLEEK